MRTTSRGRGGWAALACVALMSACSDRGPNDAPLPTPSPAVVVPALKPAPSNPPAAPSPPAKVVEPAVALVRVALVEGSPQHDGGAIVVGARLTDGAIMRLAAGDKLSLDVAQSGRVAVEGPATLQLGTDASGQILAASGVFTVIVPPAGDGILIPQRVATQQVSFSFRPGTTSVFAIHPKGDVLIHVLDGAAEILSSDITGQDVPAVSVNPGSAQRFDRRGVTPLKPAEDLNDALSKARKLVSTPSKAVAQSRELPLRVALDEALTAIEGEITQGTQIAARHKQAIATGQPEERSALQRELAAHGQRLFRLRRSTLTRWEHAQVAVLTLEPELRVQALEALASVRQRVTALLPR